MAFPLKTVKLDQGWYFDSLSRGDEAAIKKHFNEFINDEKTFKVIRLSCFDKFLVLIGLVATGALIYFAATNTFFDNPALTYSAMGVTGVAILKVGYRQYDISQGKKHLYIGLAILSAHPHLVKHGREKGHYVMSSSRCFLPDRLLAQEDLRKARYHFFGKSDSELRLGEIFNENAFIYSRVVPLRILLSVNPKDTQALFQNDKSCFFGNDTDTEIEKQLQSIRATNLIT
jgi:hypothetical protein